MPKSPLAGYDCEDCGCELTRAEHRRGYLCVECERAFAVELVRWKYGDDNPWLDAEMMFGRKPS